MAMNKEEAEARYTEAQEKAQAANAELREAVQELDRFLAEEEAQRHAVYLGYEEGDEEGIRAAKAITERRRAEKEALKARALDSDGVIGGVS